MGEKKAEVPVGKELVRMTGIMKEFPGVKALDNVKLDLYAGEVLALLGENGAGKSTLMKILSGVYQRDDGEIILFGNKIGERAAGLPGGGTLFPQLLCGAAVPFAAGNAPFGKFSPKNIPNV